MSELVSEAKTETPAPAWVGIAIAFVFALAFTAFLAIATIQLVTLPSQLSESGLGAVTPWWALVLGLFVAPIVFIVALLAGRRQRVWRKIVIFVMALLVTAGFSLGVQALVIVLVVAGISTPA